MTIYIIQGQSNYVKGIFLRNITVIFGKLKVINFSRKHLAKLRIIIFK
jgi:hypothetical protein